MHSGMFRKSKMPVEIIDDTGVNILFSEQVESVADIWLIHGFAECSDSFKSLFETTLVSQFNIYIPDLPGFGKSSFIAEYLDLNNIVKLLINLIGSYSNERPIIILGHSLGGTIATELIPKLNNILLFINVEGMLVEDNCNARSLTKAGEFQYAKKFIEYMQSRFNNGVNDNCYIKRYLENVLKANPNIIHAWASSATEMLKDNKIASLYRDLNCRTLYMYGENTMSKLEMEYLITAKFDRVMIPGVGHWPMLENSETFWKIICEKISLITIENNLAEGKKFTS